MAAAAAQAQGLVDSANDRLVDSANDRDVPKWAQKWMFGDTPYSGALRDIEKALAWLYSLARGGPCPRICCCRTLPPRGLVGGAAQQADKIYVKIEEVAR